VLAGGRVGLGGEGYVGNQRTGENNWYCNDDEQGSFLVTGHV